MKRGIEGTNICLAKQVFPNIKTRGTLRLERRWTSRQWTYHHEVVAGLREDLRRDWFIIKSGEYRLQLEHIWSPRNPLHGDHEMLELGSIPNPKN